MGPFADLDARMQWYVDEGIVPCVETALLRGTEIVHRSRHGFMDLESRSPLRDDAIYRVFSNTKIVTSVALMTLHEEGRFGLDDELSVHLPEFAAMTVLRPDAESIDDAVPTREPIRIRHLLSHTAGFSYGFLDPLGVLDQAYAAAGIEFGGGGLTLTTLCERLGRLPLASEPGTRWRYSFATDVCARLAEVLTGQPFDMVLRERVLEPLEMTDTGFWVPPEQIDRVPTMYAPVAPGQPMQPGLKVADEPATGRWSRPPTLLSGGGGLVSTIDDHARFAAMIAAGGTWNGTRVIGADTLRAMRVDQLPPGVPVKLVVNELPSTGFGLGFALKHAPGPGEPPEATGEYHWGGMAGTHTWMAPAAGIAGLVFTQRMPAFLHPFSQDAKRLMYEAAARTA